MLFGEGRSLVQGQYTIYLDVPEAPGVTVDTPVRKNGVLIGRVADVELRNDHVRLTALIDDHRQLRKHEVCRIGSGSILGDAVLEFVPPSGEDAGAAGFLQEGDVHNKVVVAGDPLKALEMLVGMEGDFRSTLQSIDNAGQKFAALADNVNQIVGGNQDQAAELLEKLDRALESFNRTMDSFNQVAGDEELRERLKQALDGLPEFIEETRQTVVRARVTLSNIDSVAGAAQRNLENLEGLTGPLGESGPRLVESVEQTIAHADQLVAQLSQFSQAGAAPPDHG
jgi:phospholipid/cholesterol/gamma-HCH transport system substrate-binding protein